MYPDQVQFFLKVPFASNFQAVILHSGKFLLSGMLSLLLLVGLLIIGAWMDYVSLTVCAP